MKKIVLFILLSLNFFSAEARFLNNREFREATSPPPRTENPDPIIEQEILRQKTYRNYKNSKADYYRVIRNQPQDQEDYLLHDHPLQQEPLQEDLVK